MRDAQRLGLVRGVHTAIYVVMATSTFVVLYGGVTGARGAWLWVALGLVLVEACVFVGGGMKCPLTAVAAKYATTGGVSDTFFPERMTRHTFAVFAPLMLIGVVLLALRWFGLLT